MMARRRAEDRANVPAPPTELMDWSSPVWTDPVSCRSWCSSHGLSANFHRGTDSSYWLWVAAVDAWCEAAETTPRDAGIGRPRRLRPWPTAESA